jgi:hypothetical protein
MSNNVIVDILAAKAVKHLDGGPRPDLPLLLPTIAWTCANAADGDLDEAFEMFARDLGLSDDESFTLKG